MEIKLEFDESHRISWGYYYCKSCEVRIYDITQLPIHSCGSNGNSRLVYRFGRSEVDAVLGNKRDGIHRLLKSSDLETCFPELVKEWIGKNLSGKQ
jgi:hypothetical protein